MIWIHFIKLKAIFKFGKNVLFLLFKNTTVFDCYKKFYTDEIKIDNSVFRLHYKATVLFLMLCVTKNFFLEL